MPVDLIASTEQCSAPAVEVLRIQALGSGGGRGVRLYPPGCVCACVRACACACACVCERERERESTRHGHEPSAPRAEDHALDGKGQLRLREALHARAAERVGVRVQGSGFRVQGSGFRVLAATVLYYGHGCLRLARQRYRSSGASEASRSFLRASRTWRWSPSATASSPACFRISDSGFSVQGLGCKDQGSGCKVQGAGCRVQGVGSAWLMLISATPLLPPAFS